MNDCKFIGRITKDPEYRVTSSGTQLINFELAVRRSYKNQNDEYEADFIRCIAFKKTAEFINNYARKGYLMAVAGEMRNNNYEDQNGVKHYGMQLIVNNVDSQVLFQSKKNDDSHQQSSQPTYSSTQTTTGQNNNPFNNSGPIDISDDDLPF
ncbi:single-stranded DNA-binding protein [Macrococcoides caseolyticum]|uniref:Single-stranded DNA-binding protein n=1 Tax=Macrococcoides caseolyticum TaxID=69966 RepID=A0ACC9MVM5_9STAP|nr:single-stranded DNA-binding protein [Macrococcus caseolyticus]PKE57515.1 single-stranded DNA-binding protein [Macrococcus caseolyticus]STY76167.1 Helix-destabilizing protein [Macrococcus caseolyticus]